MKKTVSKLADELFELKTQIKKLEAEKAKISDKIMGQIKEGQVIEGQKAKVKLIEYVNYNVSPQKLYRKLTPQNFIKCVKVQVTQARNFLGQNQITNISDVVPSLRLDVRPIRKEQ